MNFLKELQQRVNDETSGADNPVAQPSDTDHVDGPRASSGDGSSGGGGFLDGLMGGKHMQSHAQDSSGGGLMGKLNSAMGGGARGEANEDLLDKGVDFVQQHFLGQGDQSNESAIEQAKDEAISDEIRRVYKERTGHDFPIKDKS